jgi:hypothetical protein
MGQLGVFLPPVPDQKSENAKVIIQIQSMARELKRARSKRMSDAQETGEDSAQSKQPTSVNVIVADQAVNP